MKRILLTISSGLVNAGVPNVIMKIVSSLSGKAIFDIVVLGKEKNYFDDLFESYGGKIFRLPKYHSQRERIKYSFRAIEYTSAIRKILKENDPYDVIHCNDGIGAGSTLLASRDLQVPITIIHSHGTYVKYTSKNLILHIHNSIYLKVIRTYPICRVACSDVAGKTLFGEGVKFLNLLNPVDVSAYRSIDKLKNTNTIRLLQLGYFCRNKNQMFSLRLLKQMTDKGRSVHLNLMGFEQEMEYVKQMKEFINEFNLEQYVSFIPHDAEKKKVFAQTDIMLLPSFSEGLPLVLLEAQSARIKCIVSDTVPRDGNVGLCQFLGLGNIDAWEKEVLNQDLLDLDKIKLNKFDTENYMIQIANLYGLIE
jgi:glycosyltransferase involved in cell wall biosynthesis